MTVDVAVDMNPNIDATVDVDQHPQWFLRADRERAGWIDRAERNPACGGRGTLLMSTTTSMVASMFRFTSMSTVAEDGWG